MRTRYTWRSLPLVSWGTEQILCAYVFRARGCLASTDFGRPTISPIHITSHVGSPTDAVAHRRRSTAVAQEGRRYQGFVHGAGVGCFGRMVRAAACPQTSKPLVPGRSACRSSITLGSSLLELSINEKQFHILSTRTEGTQPSAR